MKTFARWWWIIPLTLLWPLLHLLVYFIRFGEMPLRLIRGMYVYLPMGLVAAIAFVLLWAFADTRARKAGIILGYLIAGPFSFIGSLFSGLVWTPILGSLCYGATPLLAGMVLGYFIGSLFPRASPEDPLQHQKLLDHADQ